VRKLKECFENIQVLLLIELCSYLCNVSHNYWDRRLVKVQLTLLSL